MAGARLYAADSFQLPVSSWFPVPSCLVWFQTINVQALPTEITNREPWAPNREQRTRETGFRLPN